MADTHAAATNFLNALERIPGIIDQYKDKIATLEREIPQLQEIAGKTWKKEDELKQLKSELAALDRKIQLELAPPGESVPDGEKPPLQDESVPKPVPVEPQLQSGHTMNGLEKVKAVFQNGNSADIPSGIPAKEGIRPKGLKL